MNFAFSQSSFSIGIVLFEIFLSFSALEHDQRLVEAFRFKVCLRPKHFIVSSVVFNFSDNFRPKHDIDGCSGCERDSSKDAFCDRRIKTIGEGVAHEIATSRSASAECLGHCVGSAIIAIIRVEAEGMEEGREWGIGSDAASCCIGHSVAFLAGARPFFSSTLLVYRPTQPSGNA